MAIFQPSKAIRNVRRSGPPVVGTDRFPHTVEDVTALGASIYNAYDTECSNGSLEYRALSISITSVIGASLWSGYGSPTYLREIPSSNLKSESRRRSTTRPRSCASL